MSGKGSISRMSDECLIDSERRFSYCSVCQAVTQNFTLAPRTPWIFVFITFIWWICSRVPNGTRWMFVVVCSSHKNGWLPLLCPAGAITNDWVWNIRMSRNVDIQWISTLLYSIGQKWENQDNCCFCPCRATFVEVCRIPRVLPWAVGLLGFQPVSNHPEPLLCERRELRDLVSRLRPSPSLFIV